MMPGVGDQRGGVNALSDPARPAKEQLFGKNRKQWAEDSNRKRRTGRLAAKMLDFPPAQPKSHGSQHRADHQGHNRFYTLMPIGVAFVSRSGPVFETDQNQQVGTHIGKAVHGVGDNGLRAAQNAERELYGGQQQVDHQSNDGDVASLFR